MLGRRLAGDTDRHLNPVADEGHRVADRACPLGDDPEELVFLYQRSEPSRQHGDGVGRNSRHDRMLMTEFFFGERRHGRASLAHREYRSDRDALYLSIARAPRPDPFAGQRVDV